MKQHTETSVSFALYSGTKRLVSVNICSVEGNSAGSFRNKGKMNAYYFLEDKTAVLGERKAQLSLFFGRQISAAKFEE